MSPRQLIATVLFGGCFVPVPVVPAELGGPEPCLEDHCFDWDGDGFTADVDCQDGDATVYPGAEEIPYDGIDQDCDGQDLDDLDGDGFVLAGDCDDTDAAVHPGATEVCDGVDQDCDDLVDEGVLVAWHPDADTDGFGDPGSESWACEAPPGEVADATDCDDSDAAVHPGARELCDRVDNDCDGRVDVMVAGGTHDTVQEALDAACKEGDTVLVLPGTYVENVQFPAFNLTLASTDGPEITALDGSACSGDACSVLVIDGGNDDSTVIEGLTITGGYAYAGGGARVGTSSGATFRSCLFEDNIAVQFGGGIQVEVAALTVVVDDCRFVSNEVIGDRGGAIHAAGSTSGALDIRSSVFERNTALGMGAGVYTRSETWIDMSTFLGNDAGLVGGGVFCESQCSIADFTNTTWQDNVAGFAGGAINSVNDRSLDDAGAGNVFIDNEPDDFAHCCGAR